MTVTISNGFTISNANFYIFLDLSLIHRLAHILVVVAIATTSVSFVREEMKPLSSTREIPHLVKIFTVESISVVIIIRWSHEKGERFSTQNRFQMDMKHKDVS